MMACPCGCDRHPAADPYCDICGRVRPCQAVLTRADRYINVCATCYIGPSGEAERIAEVFDEARAELDRGL